MASDLSLSISVSAVVGGALSGLTNIGKAMNTLKSTTAHLTTKQNELGESLERNKNRLSDTSAAHLWRQYDQAGAAIDSLKRKHEQLAKITARKISNQEQWQNLKGQWQSAVASAGALVLPIKLAIDFESAMAGVKKVVDFDTPEQFKQMSQDIVAMSRQIPMAANELAAIAASGGQLGIARQDLLGFTEQIAKMSVAFDMSAEQAGDSMAKLANVYKIPIAKIGELGDAINHLSNSSPAKASDIVNTLGRVGGVARQFGLTEKQTASLATAFISLGKPPEVAGTAINGMLTKLATADKGGKKFQAALKGMGISAQQLKQNIAKNGEQALVDFLKQVDKIPKENQLGTLVDLFGLEYADDVAALVGGLDTYQKSIQSLTDTDKNGKLTFLGSMEREFEAQKNTTSKHIQLLKNSLVGLGITVGTMLLPAVNRFVAGTIQVVNGLNDWAQQHPTLTKAIISTIAAILAFISGGFVVRVLTNRIIAAFLILRSGAAALSASMTAVRAVMQSGMGFTMLSGNLGKIMRGLTIARTAMMALGLSSAFAFIPILLAIAAVASAAALIYVYWKPIKAFFIGFWQGLQDGIAPILPVLEMIGAGWKGLFDLAMAFLSPIITWFRELGFVSDETAQSAQGFGYFFGTMLGSVLGSVITIGNMIVSGWSMIFDGIFSFASTAWENIKAAFDGGLTGILALIINWSPIGAFYSAFAAVLDWFGITLPTQFTEFGSMLIDGLVNGIKAKISNAVAAVQGLAAQIKGAFTSSKSMDIHSPSRVFRSYGGFITEGLAMGVNRGASQPIGKISQLAGSLKSRFAERMSSFRSNLSARLSTNADNLSQARAEYSQAQFNNGGTITIHFNPTINAAGGNPQQIETALQMGLREFEDLFHRMIAEQQRRAY